MAKRPLNGLGKGSLSWSGRRDSNPRPSPWQGDALPTEPRPQAARYGGLGSSLPSGSASGQWASSRPQPWTLLLAPPTRTNSVDSTAERGAGRNGGTMLELLTAVAALLRPGAPGLVSAADIDDDIPEAEMFGTGSAGSLTPTPDCPRLQFVTVQNNAYVCAPRRCRCRRDGRPLPRRAMSGVGEPGDGVHPIRWMKTHLECILPIAVDWLASKYQDETLAPPSEWNSPSQSCSRSTSFTSRRGVVQEAFGGQHCGGYDSSTALQYCPQDGNIYFCEELLWFTYTNYGDADLWVRSATR